MKDEERQTISNLIYAVDVVLIARSESEIIRSIRRKEVPGMYAK